VNLYRWESNAPAGRVDPSGLINTPIGQQVPWTGSSGKGDAGPRRYDDIAGKGYQGGGTPAPPAPPAPKPPITKNPDEMPDLRQAGRPKLTPEEQAKLDAETKAGNEALLFTAEMLATGGLIRFARMALAARAASAGYATRGMGGRVLSAAEKAEFDAFAQRAQKLGLVENPHRTGSWGRMTGGKFDEVARIDVAEVGKPGWRGRTHIHITGQNGHLNPAMRLPGE
jgi:hypothetical protein